MKTMRWLMFVVITLLAASNLSGCSFYNLITPTFDMTTDAQGQHILADTPQNWQQWRSVINPQIANEVAGEKSPINTWKQNWIQQIENFEEIQENAPRYIDYIIESRRRAGLPELEYRLPQ